MKIVRNALLAFLAGTLSSFCLFGCIGAKHGVDYEGKKDLFRGAKDCYRAGQEVTLYYMLATDTNYSFYLDNERLNSRLDEERGAVITFIMPDHDVKLSVRSVNSMIDTEEPVFSRQATLSYHSFDGGGPEYGVEIEDPSVLSCTSSREYGRKDHDEIDGASYEVIFVFHGLKPGTTVVTVKSHSPIDGSEDSEIYDVTVGDDLEISLALRD